MQVSELPVGKQPKVQAAVKTIVHWVNVRGHNVHCLVRIFKENSGITVIASTIRSNVQEEYRHRGVCWEVAAISDQLYKEFPKEMDLSPDQVIWIVHYGEFSNFWGMENIDSERFHQTHLKYDGGKLEEIEDKFITFTEKEQKEKLGHLDIKDVYDDLNEIGWTRHIAGVRYIPASGKPLRSLDEVMGYAKKAT
jgi:hypothetical protein